MIVYIVAKNRNSFDCIYYILYPVLSVYKQYTQVKQYIYYIQKNQHCLIFFIALQNVTIIIIIISKWPMHQITVSFIGLFYSREALYSI